MILYGAWRFGIEFFRADERGKTFVPGLTPSQLTAIVFVILGFVLLILALRNRRRNNENE